MSFTLREIADSIGGELVGADPDLEITGISGLDNAGPQDISFFANSKYESAFRNTKAGVVIVDGMLNGVEDLEEKPLIKVSVTYVAMTQLLPRFFERTSFDGLGIMDGASVNESAEIGKDVTVLPLAYIGPGAKVGDRSIVHPNAYIGPGVEMGTDCQIWANVVLREGTTIGNRVTVQPGAVIGGDGFGYVPIMPGQHMKIPQLGGVRLEDDVEIGANATIDAGTMEPTVIGKGTKIDNLVQIAHNVQTGEGCLVISQAGISGSTRLGDRVILAAQVGLVGHIHLDDDVMVGAQSGVTKSLTGGKAYLGSPAIPIDDQKRVYALNHMLPKLRNRIKSLEDRLEALEE